MKKHIISAICAVSLVLAGSMAFTSCKKTELDTNQYEADAVTLNAYGPLPVMRGGTLRFIGSNLDRVASVQIPGADPITDIEVVKSGVPSEIHITVPHDNCTEGTVILVTKDGKEIEAKTPIRYTEGLDPANITIPAKATPGDVIKITVPETGDDYLDIIHMVEFAKGVQVGEKQFKSHTRYLIELAVPEAAQTGKLNLYTADLTDPEIAESASNYQTISTQSVLEVATPTTTKVSSPRGDATAEGVVTAKQGEKITLTGTLYNLVKSVKIGSVEITGLTLSGATSLSFTVPAEAADEEISLVCASGAEVPVATLSTIAPSELSVSPATVKAGEALIVSGKDMDVVVAVELPGAGKQDGDKITVEADKVTVKSVPDNATAGELKLHMANGKSVSVAYAQVLPTVTAYDKNPVSAGGQIKITGTDLDLVKSIEFGSGKVTLAASDVTATSITTIVPMDAQSGKPQFVLANGAKVEGPELKIDEAVFCYITELPTEDTKPDAGSVVTVPVKNGEKLTGVSVDGKDVNYVYDPKNSTLTFGIPVEAGSTAKVKLTSSNGEIEYSMPVKPATEVEKVVFVGPVSIDWSSNKVYIKDEAMEGVPETAVMHMEFTQHEAWGQVQINNADWKQLPFEGTENGYIKTGTFNDKSVTEIDLPFTAEIMANIKAASALKGEGNSIIIQGQNWTINKISFKWQNVLEKDIAPFVSLMNGNAITYPLILTWGDDGRFKLSKDLLLNEFKVKKGSVLRFYKTAGTSAQYQINNWSWKAVYFPKEDSAEGKARELYEQVFDDAMMEAVEGGGLIIQGSASSVTKIAILP